MANGNNPTVIDLSIRPGVTDAQRLDMIDALAAWCWAAGADDVTTGWAAIRATVSDPAAVEPLLRALERDDRAYNVRAY